MSSSKIPPWARLPRRVPALLLALLVLGAAGPVDAGSTFERGLGRPVAEQLEEEVGVVRDPALSGWVERVGSEIVRADGGEPRDYSFKILESDDVNAFAIPGGFIYVTLGLLRFVESEDELAAVLGHEIAHLTAHHGVKQLRREILLTLGLVLLRGYVTDTVSTLSQVGGVLYSLRHSRADEAAADAGGLVKMLRAGYDPIAMAAFLEKCAEREKQKPSRLEVYFMTHPPTADRLERATHRPETDPRNTEVRRAVAKGYTERGLYRQAIRAHEQVLAREPHDVAQHLAAARCWEQLGHPDRAREEWSRAAQLDPGVKLPPAKARKPRLPAVPRADREAASRARAALATANRQIAASDDARATQIGDLRKALGNSKRRFRHFLNTLGSAVQPAATGDLIHQEMLREIGLAVANLDRALSRVQVTLEAAGTVPDRFSDTIKTLDGQLASSTPDEHLLVTAESLPPSVSRSLSELTDGVKKCREALKQTDAAIRVCHTAAQDLQECVFLPAPVVLARVGHMNSRLRVAVKAAASAADLAGEARALAEAATARHYILALDRLAHSVPTAQRAPVCALLTRRHGIPPAQATGLAREGVRLGDATASLLLGLAVRVPLKTEAPAENGPGAIDDRPIKPLSLDEALERRVPLAPLNAGLRLFLLDMERETEGSGPR
ncbi:MAG TPA: M48 family metalloprotease [Armatimonadetes bacterium]|jgi:tetratricopeptide (TPR) repeat protein|nr:M48 family metalloprotease [Armatimonadota bacterium]